MRPLRKETRSMQTSNLGRLSARLLQASNSSSSSSSSNPYGGLGHLQSNQGKHPMVSLKYIRAWARPNQVLLARLPKVLFRRHQAVLAMCLHHLPAA